PAPQRYAVIGRPLLRDVPDPPVTATDRRTEERRRTGAEPGLPEDRLEEAGLPGPVGAQYGDQLAAAHLQVEAVPERAGPEAERGLLQGQYDAHRPSAAPTASRFAVIQPM